MRLKKLKLLSRKISRITQLQRPKLCSNPLPFGWRPLHTSSVCRTYGVYPALIDKRVQTPWVEALMKKRTERFDPLKQSEARALAANRDLRPRKMSDSFHKIIIPLGQDPWLSDTYLDANGLIKLGQLFMDLDALAGIIAYKHTGESVTTVTAAVDRITVTHPLTERCDLELSGQVTFATGRSSMVVSLQVAKASHDGEKPKKRDILMTCAFIMVSLDPFTKRPVPINPLQIETAEERRVFELGEKNYNSNKAFGDPDLWKQTPNEQEKKLIHRMWRENRSNWDITNSPHNKISMDKAVMHTNQIMQPQYRNRHDVMIFGGFLLRETYELAFCCAATLCKSTPKFLSLDPSTFTNPVPVGSVLHLHAMISNTRPFSVALKGDNNQATSGGFRGDENSTGSRHTRVQVRVESIECKIDELATKSTGLFNYTFLVEKNIEVIPRSYRDYMLWMDARRRAERLQASIERTEKVEETVEDRLWEKINASWDRGSGSG